MTGADFGAKMWMHCKIVNLLFCDEENFYQKR